MEREIKISKKDKKELYVLWRYAGVDVDLAMASFKDFLLSCGRESVWKKKKEAYEAFYRNRVLKYFKEKS